MSQRKNKLSTHRLQPAQILILIVSACALYVLIPQIKFFHASLSILLDAQISMLIVSGIFVILTFCFSSAAYTFLAGKKFNFFRGLLIESSGMFTNRLLPAGIGGIGINFLYLKKQKFSANRAAAIVAINNIVGLLGHLVLLTLGILIFWETIPALHFQYSHNEILLYPVISVLVLMTAIFIYKKYRGPIRNVFHSFIVLLIAYRHRPIHLVGAFLSSVCLTLCNIAALYYCSNSLGLHISYVVLFLVFTMGLILGTASPTPGGLGATEAGLVVGLAAFHVHLNDALALALIYRIISFWLPLLLGGLIFFVVRKLDYI